MDALIEQILLVLRGMWRRRWFGVMAAWAVAAIGLVAVLRFQDRYESEAKVYVDTKSVLRPLMRDLAVDPDLDQTIGMLGRTLITRPNVELLMKKTQLVTPETPQADSDRIAETLLRDIKVNAFGRDNVFTFSYRDTDPARGRRVVEGLVALFVESDRGAKQRDSESARGFIEEQIRQYETRLAEAENRLKDFKLRNLGTVEGPGRDFFSRIAALREEHNKLQTDLRAAEQSREALKNELSGEVATLVPDVAPAVGSASSTELDARLDGQRRQLDELLRRYTDAHPDVVATRRLIGRLEEQRQQELEALRKAQVGKPQRAQTATNPVFQQVKLALAESEANVAALKVRLSETQNRLAQMNAAASRVPQVDAELAQLNRDYEIVRRQYEALVARRERAALTEDVDATRPAQFRVIDPPRAAPRAVFPNRGTLAVAALVMALAVGVGVTFVVSQIVPTFDSAAALRRITQRPVLGTISMLPSADMVRRARHGALAFGGAVGGLFLLFGGLIMWMSVVMTRLG
jgi:polysaccharide chain length determinant protein (PEP-CTERM system associated)